MKKNIFFIGVSICLLVLLGVGLSYSMWNMNISQDTNNVIATTSECFDVAITSQENAIKLENAYPISDTKGKSLTPFTFTVKNTCDMFASYSVSLESLKESTLPSEFLKVMVNDNEPKLLNSLDSTDTVNSGSIESRVLAKGSLSKDSSKDYSVRLWIDYDTTLEDLDNEIKILKSKIIIKAIPQGYAGETIFNFNYTGAEQIFTVPVSGTYKLETWGASGVISHWGGQSGYGGYSTGLIHLNKSDLVFLNIGGSGSNRGYNGGDSSECDNLSSGGGATHIATKSGLLSSLENYISDILIVSGGGGGAERQAAGSGGGITGNNGFSITNDGNLFGTGGSQIAGGTGSIHADNPAKFDVKGSFGQGGCGRSTLDSGPNGGGGFYGGGATTLLGGAGGGSGYIGNSLLTDKTMYCYNCQESSEESTKTISTTCNEETPTENCAKKGNGYARITLISIDE